MARPRLGYLRIHVLLRREGWLVNKKRVRRLYRLEGLQVRMRVRRRKHMALHRGPAPIPTGPAQRRSMDFVHDQLLDGPPFRVLTVVDQWGRQSPALEAATSFTGRDGVAALDRVLQRERAPASITVDHGTAGSLGLLPRRTTRFHPARKAHGQLAHRIVQWPAAGRVPERPAVFSLADARAMLEIWRVDYNQQRPHGSLGQPTPSEVVTQRQHTRTIEAGLLQD